MQAGNLGARHGKQAKRIVVAQVRLGHEGELGKVSQTLEIIRMNTLFDAFLAVGLDVVVSVAQRPFQAFDLQGGNFVATGNFNRIKFAGQGFF